MRVRAFASVLMITLVLLSGCGNNDSNIKDGDQTPGSVQEIETSEDVKNDGRTSEIVQDDTSQKDDFDYKVLPEYSGVPYCEVNGNTPVFSKEEKTDYSYEFYGNLDEVGRCTECIANVGSDLMPTEKRGSIGMVKPSGWHTVRYNCIEDSYLYNRCHLIAYCLTAENANERNLITGTRYMNIEGMLPFEEQVAKYIDETSNHVLYKSTPIFLADELVARGVHLQAYSVEDNGKGISFNVFCYNVQPGIVIDYSTGDSYEA